MQHIYEHISVDVFASNAEYQIAVAIASDNAKKELQEIVCVSVPPNRKIKKKKKICQHETHSRQKGYGKRNAKMRWTLRISTKK